MQHRSLYRRVLAPFGVSFAVALSLGACTRAAEAPAERGAEKTAETPAPAEGAKAKGQHGDHEGAEDCPMKNGDSEGCPMEHGSAHGGHGEHGGHGAHDDHAAPLGGHHRGHGKHHRFDDPEAWAKEFDSAERIAWQKPDAVIAKLAPAKSAVVADLGAGTGAFAVRFAAAVPEGKVLANDVEASMVEYLGKRATEAGLNNLVAVQGTADDPKLPEAVDLAFMCDVFHHIEDVPRFFAAVRERMKEGGRLAIVDFKKDAPDDAPGPPAAMRVSSSDVVKQLTELGFRVAEVDTTTLEYQYIVVFDRG